MLFCVGLTVEVPFVVALTGFVGRLYVPSVDLLTTCGVVVGRTVPLVLY